MDLSTAVKALERNGFDVTLQRNANEPDRARHVAISRDGWFATRVRLPVNRELKPDVHVGIVVDLEPNAFVFWRPSHMATPTWHLALAVAFEFVEPVRYALYQSFRG